MTLRALERHLRDGARAAAGAVRSLRHRSPPGDFDPDGLRTIELGVE
jgi:hypothetical protein